MGKPNSLLRQLVDSGRLIRLRAVATQAIDREIVSHDEKNVRTVIRNSHQGKAREEKKDKQGFHGFEALSR
jgi:hypothetical protein